MCFGCYEEYGKPTIVNDLTRSAAATIDQVYGFSITGGNLHIVLDDWNVEDEHILWCQEQIAIRSLGGRDDRFQLLTEDECAQTLGRMTQAERVSALAIHSKFLVPADAQQE